MEGYAKVAGLMVKHPEVATFQRFDYLNTLNILYLQAELVHLERDLRQSMKDDLESPMKDAVQSIRSVVLPHDDEEIIPADRDDESGSVAMELNHFTQGTGIITPDDDSQSLLSDGSSFNERAEGAKDWYYLSTSQHGETWRLMLKVRAKLKEYNKAVLRQQHMKKSHSPTPSDAKFLRHWFTGKEMGDFPLKGRDHDVWTSSSPKDLIAVKAREGDDPLGSLFLNKVFLWWHTLVGHKFKKPMDEEAQYFEYGDNSILRMANILASIMTSLLMVGSIVVLYFVTNPLARLGIIAAFTQIFSLVLILATSASKAEVFAATAAFVAVMVVFIGNNGNNTITPNG